jgi:hypothetical protein
MSAKEEAIELIRRLPDDVSLGGIVAALQEAHETAEAIRRFDERGGIPDEDLTDEEWAAMIARSWADDLNDPRQDIYSLEPGDADESR